MAKYKVTWELDTSREYLIDADTEDEAYKRSLDLWREDVYNADDSWTTEKLEEREYEVTIVLNIIESIQVNATSEDEAVDKATNIWHMNSYALNKDVDIHNVRVIK